MKLDVTANTANAVSFNLSAAGAQAEPLLHDFAGYDRLSGTIDMQTSMSVQGVSQRAMVGSLAGNGKVHFHDGKLKGVDLAGLISHYVTGAGSGSPGHQLLRSSPPHSPPAKASSPRTILL